MSLDGWLKLLTAINLAFLAKGLAVTVLVTAVSGVLSTVFGAGLAVYRSMTSGPWRWPATLFVEAFRNLPVLVVIYFVRFGPPAYGLSFEALTAGIIGLTLYNSAMLGEVFRAGIESVPKGQLSAARAIGLTTPQCVRHVLLPQGWANALPSFVGQQVVLLQSSTLVSAIGVLELTGAAQVLYNRDANPLETFTLLAAVYYLLDFTLVGLRNRLERRVRRRYRAATA